MMNDDLDCLPGHCTVLHFHQLLFGPYQAMYRTRAIISRGLYIFYPIFKDHFFVLKEVFSENSALMYGLYSRASSNQERLIVVRVWYMSFNLISDLKAGEIILVGTKIEEDKEVFTFEGMPKAKLPDTPGDLAEAPTPN